MNLFRRWHDRHEFHHHFGHGHHGHRVGRPADADGLVDHLAARAGAKLDLDEGQQRLLAAWLQQLQRQREALKGLAGSPELGGLVAGEQFPRESAEQLLHARLDALRAAAPDLVATFAAFFDALDAEQRQVLRFMMRRFAPAGRQAGRA